MKLLKKLSCLLLALPLLCFTLIPLAAGRVEASAQEEWNGADFRSGAIKYILEDPLQETPNTFEARIKLEEDAPAVLGYLFSNEVLRGFNQLSLSYYINAEGNLCVQWNGGEKQVIFDDCNLRNGRWTHVAVVRDEVRGTFSLFVDGELKQTLQCGAGANIKAFTHEHCIGGDFHSTANVKSPFPGRIAEVTLYSLPLSGGEVMRDCLNPDTITAAARQGLMFHAQLKVGDVKLTDTSRYHNDAYLGTNDFFFEGEFFETRDYTLSVLPDLQMLTNHYQEPISTLPEFLLNNVSSMKIGAMLTVGDLTDGITNGRDWDRQYNKVSKEFAKLDGKIPYVPVPGNHDYDNECKTDHSVSHFNGAFPIEKFSQTPTWGGSFSADSIVNAYYLMEFGGVKYCIFALDFGPSDEVLDWCCDITEQYPDRRVILLTHGFLDGTGDLLRSTSTDAPSVYGWSSNKNITVNDADDIWEKWLKKYPNVFMTFSGHVFGDDIVVREYVGDNGNVVASFLLNVQGLIMNDGLELMLGLFSFDESEQNVYVNFYSTIRNKFLNYQNQFVYSFRGNTKLVSPTAADTAAARTPDRSALLSGFVSATGVGGQTAASEKLLPSTVPVTMALLSAVIIAPIFVLRRRKK